MSESSFQRPIKVNKALVSPRVVAGIQQPARPGSRRQTLGTPRSGSALVPSARRASAFEENTDGKRTRLQEESESLSTPYRAQAECVERGERERQRETERESQRERERESRRISPAQSFSSERSAQSSIRSHSAFTLFTHTLSLQMKL